MVKSKIMVVEDEGISAHIEMIAQTWMQTIDQALAGLVKDKMITQEDAVASCTQPLKFEQYLRRYQGDSWS